MMMAVMRAQGVSCAKQECWVLRVRHSRQHIPVQQKAHAFDPMHRSVIKQLSHMPLPREAECTSSCSPASGCGCCKEAGAQT